MIFRWFESRIKVFDEVPEGTPPKTVGRFYLFYLRQVWPVFVALLVVGFFVAGIEVALFGFIGRLVDLVKNAEAATFFTAHGEELAWMAFVVVIARPFFSFLHNLLINQTVAPHLTNRIRWQNHRYVMQQSMAFFQNDHAGRIANRIMRTGMSIRQSTMQVVNALWYVTVYVGSAMALFVQADVWLVAPLLVWVVFYIGALAIFIPQLKKRSWLASAAASKLMGRVVDGYTNVLTLKLFARRRHETRYVRDAMAEQTHKLARMTRISTLLNSSVTTMNGGLIAGTAALGLWLWSKGNVTVGDIALSTGLVIRISNMSGWIMMVVNMVFEAVGTVQDGITSISHPLDVQDAPDAPPLKVTNGEVRLTQVGFHYDQQRPLFEQLDLAVKGGEKIGLVGPSGAGKSTLVRLLLRLYDLNQGQIHIDGQDIARVSQESLRSQIGMVTQDTSLLHRSIRDNILYGDPSADEAAIDDAVRRAKADTFIPQLEDNKGRKGYDALVGERGVKLSGGQRQRIAIARVLLKNAPILILDEATSALDSEVEAAIQDSLDALMDNKTVIAIAHRLSTIARMDRLIVMEEGRIVEMGSHNELLANNGLYARLWQRQTGGYMGEV